MDDVQQYIRQEKPVEAAGEKKKAITAELDSISQNKFGSRL